MVKVATVPSIASSLCRRSDLLFHHTCKRKKIQYRFMFHAVYEMDMNVRKFKLFDCIRKNVEYPTLSLSAKKTYVVKPSQIYLYGQLFSMLV